MSITPITSKITPLSMGQAVSQASPTTAAQGIENTFGGILKNLETTQATSDNLLQQLAAGEDIDLGHLKIATSKTDIDFKVAMGIRDRLVTAYQDITRMSV